MARRRILVDTSILIDHLRKQHKDQTIFYRYLANYDYAISVITEFEFRIGITPKNREFGEKLFSVLPSIPVDATCVNMAVHIYSQLRSSNQLIPLADILIAATAIAHNLPLLTFNHKHFSRIPELNLYPHQE